MDLGSQGRGAHGNMRDMNTKCSSMCSRLWQHSQPGERSEKSLVGVPQPDEEPCVLENIQSCPPDRSEAADHPTTVGISRSSAVSLCRSAPRSPGNDNRHQSGSRMITEESVFIPSLFKMLFLTAVETDSVYNVRLASDGPRDSPLAPQPSSSSASPILMTSLKA